MYSTGEEDNNFEEYEENSAAFKPWPVLYAIDTHPLMFASNEEETTPFQDCIRALLYCADSSLILTPRSMKSPMGVVLAENESEKAQFIEYSTNMPDNVKFLRTVSNTPIDDLKKSYERKGGFDLADFLSFCKHQLDQLKVAAFKKTIIYITNDWDPTGDDEKLKEKVKRLIESLSEQGVYLRIVTTNPNFDAENFYEGIFENLDFKPIEYVQSTDDLQELLASYLQTRVFKVSYKFYPFWGKWKKFVKIHKISYIKNKQTKIINNVRVTKKDHTLVKKKFLGEVKMTPNVIVTNPSQRDKAPRVRMTREEADELVKVNIPKGIVLLYTCTRISNPGWTMTATRFIQADPKEDLPYFSHLWKALVKTNLVMVCYLKSTDKGRVYFVELEPKKINNTECFVMRTLPCAEEMRAFTTISVQEDIAKNNEAAMSSLVEKLTFDFNEKMFRNSIYKKQENYIKAQLLDEPFEREKDADEEMENARRKIDERVKDELETLKKSFPVIKKGTKRKK